MSHDMRAIVFDFDGTILDTELSDYRAWCNVCEEMGLSMPIDTFACGVGAEHLFDPCAFIEKTLGRKIDRVNVQGQWKVRFDELVNLCRVPDGLVDLLFR